MIISERYEVGVGKVTRQTRLTREILHQLCISPMAHSELVRGLQDCGQIEVVRNVIYFSSKNILLCFHFNSRLRLNSKNR